MAAIRWFRVPVGVGLWHREVYLYQTLMNLFDFQYHWMYTSRLHRGLAEVAGAAGRGLLGPISIPRTSSAADGGIRRDGGRGGGRQSGVG
jgi:hypothetical protein